MHLLTVFAGIGRAVFLPALVSARRPRLPGGGDVPSLSESLSQVMTVQGARAAALIDVATGMIVRSAGVLAGDFPAAAASMAAEARLARDVLGPGPAGGDLDEISLVTADRVHVSKILG